MSRTGEYLDEVADLLPFIEPLRREVIAELADHLEDSIGERMDKGESFAAAADEILRQMGPPEELARQITRSHQTRKRLLAAAGGGVVEGAKTAITGLLLAIIPTLAAGLVPFIIVVAARAQYLWKPVEVAGLPVAFAFTAFLIGQALPYRIALIAHRPIAWARPVVAASCAVVLAGLFWFVYRTEMPWWSVVPFASIPFWSLVGARSAQAKSWKRPGFRSPPLALVLLTTAALTSIGMIASTPVADRWDVREWQPGFVDSSGLSALGSLSTLNDFELCCFQYTRFGTISFVSSEATAPLPMYLELTAEVWPATPDLTHVNAIGAGPLASIPLEFGPWEPLGGAGTLVLFGMSFVGSGDPLVGYHGGIPLALRRDWGPTWLVLVGTRPDGSRDVLRYRVTGDEIAFDGSVAEWLLAK